MLTEISLQDVARGREPGQVEYGPLHERAAGLLGGVLIQRHDVGAGAGEKRTYRGHQSWSIGATQQEPTNILAAPPPAASGRKICTFCAGVPGQAAPRSHRGACPPRRARTPPSPELHWLIQRTAKGSPKSYAAVNPINDIEI